MRCKFIHNIALILILIIILTKTNEEHRPGKFIHTIPFIRIQSLSSTPAAQTIFVLTLMQSFWVKKKRNGKRSALFDWSQQ